MTKEELEELLEIDWDFCCGYNSGLFGLDRDWSRPDAYHRGFILGLLIRRQSKQHADRAEIADPHQIDIGGEG